MTGRSQRQLADFGISPRSNAHTELRTKRQRSARESGRQVECPYRVAGKASVLGTGTDIPKSACCHWRPWPWAVLGSLVGCGVLPLMVPPALMAPPDMGALDYEGKRDMFLAWASLAGSLAAS